MTSKIFGTLLLIFACRAISIAQVKTEATRTTTDSTGKSTTVTEVIISKSEDVTPRNNMIVINPLKFFLFYNLSYFRKISETMAFGGGFQFPTIKGVEGFGVNLEIRYYPKGKTLRGFYVAPNASYNSFGSSVHSTSIGILLGWQWFPGDDFAIGLGLGVDQYFITDKNYSSHYDGTFPAVRFDVGYAW